MPTFAARICAGLPGRVDPPLALPAAQLRESALAHGHKPSLGATKQRGTRHSATAQQAPDCLPCPHGRAHPLPLRRLPQPQQRRQAGGARAGGATLPGRPACVV
jgi:hypothetical protein